MRVLRRVGGALRWLVLPTLLAGATAYATVRVGDEQPADAVPLAPATTVVPPAPGASTPVLSARRVPAVMAVPQLDDQLATEAGIIAGRLPEGACLRLDVGAHTLVSLRADQPLVPASNQKVLTSVVALELLGPDTRLRTEVRAVAPITDGVLDGDLWMVGGGDPLLATADWVARFPRPPEPRTSLEAFADSVAATGLREVRGSLLGDDSRYDAVRYVASWPARYRSDRQTGPLSALTVNDGYVVDPADDDRADPAADPAAASAQLLVDLLAERGVVVRGGAGSAAAPPEATALAAIDSAPLREVVGEATRESDNGTAELLLKEIGKVAAGEGSTEAGARVVTDHLIAAGLPMAGVHVVDGSGLDPANTLTCDVLVSVYQRVGPSSDLVQGLSLAGESGTLTRRFEGTPVQGRLRAKSGSIRGVSSLSGVATGNDGTPLSFAVVVNDPEAADLGPAEWEALARAMVQFPGPVDLGPLGPLAPA